MGRSGKFSASHGSSFAITESKPGFCSPMALSIPPGVSVMRGVGLPARGSIVVALIMIEPSLLRS